MRTTTGRHQRSRHRKSALQVNKDSRLLRTFTMLIIIIIIHLLGLAPAGYLAAPDSGP
jgi:hypothetical protein